MTTHNADNERLKRRYFTYLKEAKRYSEASIDVVAQAVHRFERYNRFRDFKAFRIEQAVAFKRHLAAQTNERSGKPLSKSTVHSALNALRNFFQWLAGQPGFRSRLTYSDADYFNLSEKETRVAKAHREQRVPTLEQIRHVLERMPGTTEIEKRNRALIAFTILTGARDRAIASFKIKHVDLTERCVHQDAREVQTKFSKTFTTTFFPIGNDIREIVEDWIEFLTRDKLWGPDDPLFPATRVDIGANRLFEAVGLGRKHWSDAGPIRKVFKEAFERAGLPYFNPHSFRNTLAVLGGKLCRSPEQFKAWSQNLGHEKVMTTFLSYGQVAASRQVEIIRGLAGSKANSPELDDLFKQLVDTARQNPAP